MSVTIVPAVGAPNANSYATQAEVNAYFNARLPLVPPWDDADDPTAAMAMATRVFNAFMQPVRHYMPAGPTGGSRPYYLVRRQWNGTPASAAQKLAFPRHGLYGMNGNPLDVAITGNTVASPTVVTTSEAHGRTTGDSVFITGSDSTPTLDGARAVTVLSTTSFSVIVNVTVAGTAGRVTWIPSELKDAEAELAGQLLLEDTTLDNAVKVAGITSVKAGSVSVSFKDMIQMHVLPDAVFLLMPSSWFTDEVWEPVNHALFDVVSS